MANIPQYVLSKSHLAQLSDAMQKGSLNVQHFGGSKTMVQGIEQVWMCSDQKGQLFSFSTLEVNDRNVFGLKTGTVYLEVGPREKTAQKRMRKDASEALQRFEQTLIALGAQRMSPK